MIKIQYQNADICVFESALFRTTSTVIQLPDVVLIIDPNWLPQEVYAIRDYVKKIQGNKQLYLLFTHSDYDHIIGYKAFPDAIVIASEAFANNPQKEDIIEQIKKFDDDYYITRDYTITYPKPTIIVNNDNQKVILGNTKLRLFKAHGHNADGIFTIIESLGIWIAGDYLSNVEFPYIYHSSKEYLETLDKAENIIKDYQPKLLISGHGDITTDIDEMKTRLHDSRQYIQDISNAIRNGKDYDTQKLWQRYQFPRLMQSFHDANMLLIKKELEK